MKNAAYTKKLQADLCLMQQGVKHAGHRAIIVFEGRDTAGKGGTIRALTSQVIIYRGGGLTAVWRQFLMVTGVGLAFFVYSLSLFRKSIAVTK